MVKPTNELLNEAYERTHASKKTAHRIYRGFLFGPFASKEEFRSYWENEFATKNKIPYCVIDKHSGKLVGMHYYWFPDVENFVGAIGGFAMPDKEYRGNYGAEVMTAV